MRESELVQLLMEFGLWPLKRSGSNNFSVSCFFQATRHKAGRDAHPSATISFDQGESWFRCYACNTRLPIIKLLQQLDTRESIRVAAKFQEFELNPVSGLSKPGRVLETQKIRDCTPGLRKLLKNEYPEIMKSFLVSKGVTPETAKKFGVAFVPEGHEDEFLPLGPDGKPTAVKAATIFIPTLIRTKTGRTLCVGGQGRPLEGGGLKYYTMYPHPIGQYLYGQHLAHQLVGASFFLVEGAFDVMHIWQENGHALGLFGLHVNRQRCERLKAIKPTHLRIFLDPDEAGKGALIKAIKTLKDCELTASPVVCDKQPKSCSADELVALMRPETKAPGE